MGRHRVVVLGAGFGGLAVVRGLRRAPVDVVLVDANNFHTFQPLLYQVATAGLDADDVAYAVRGIFRRQRNVEVRMARVEAIDTAARTVHVDVGSPIQFDTLVLALGAITTDFGIPGVADHALPLKTLDDALAIRSHVLSCFERAAADPTQVGDGALDVVVCGGGPTGVEMAGGLMELYAKVLEHDFPNLPVRQARMVLVEMADRLLTPFSEASSQRARRSLARRGVEVVTGNGVREITNDTVTLTDGRVIRAHTVVWATGVVAHPLAATLGTPTTRGGRLVVDDHLRVPGLDRVFAIGDIAAPPGDDGAALPQVAQPAIQGGRYVARLISASQDGRQIDAFHYVDKGSMATIGRHDAVAEFPNGWRLSGPIGWVAWLGLHLVYLMGFRNRVNVFVNWAWNYLTYDRGSRILSESSRRAHRDR